MEVEVIKANNQFDEGSAVARKNRLRVAAYCRVSTNDEDQIKSYNSMVTYYTDLIKKNPMWDFAGVYADKASTGTKAETREMFQQLIADCLANKIDMIVAKSLSRFARNTLDTLKYVRMLRERKIAVYFEVEKINTMKDGEFLLTILSSVAQQEVENTSAYVKKGLKMRMKRGEMVGFQGCMGYDYDYKTKTLSINEEGAKIVRYIFERYAEGAGSTMIARELNERGAVTLRGNQWTTSAVMDIIDNEKYTGDLLMGKTFTVDPISKRRLDNLGEEDRFFVKNHHEPIISHELFDKVHDIKNRRNGGRKRGVGPGKREKFSRQFAFSCLLECGFCGANLSRRRWHSSSKYKKTIWQCVKSTKGGKRYCPDSKGIPEEVLEEAFVESYRLLTADNKSVMTEFLKRMEDELGDDAVQNRFEVARREVFVVSEKRKRLLEKYVDGGVEKDVYESMDRELQKKLREAEEELEKSEEQLDNKESIQRRIAEFKRTLSENEVLTSFDRAVFESVIEKVIVGGYDDEGKKDPYKVTFIYKNGFKDGIPGAKERFAPKKGKSDENVCSDMDIQANDVCSDTGNSAHRDGGIAVAGLGEKQV